MRTEKLELDERFGNEYAGYYVFQEISLLSAAGLFRNTPNTILLPGKLSRQNYEANPCTVVGHVKIPR